MPNSLATGITRAGTGPNMIYDYARGIFTKGLMLVWLVITSSPILLAFWLSDKHPNMSLGLLWVVIPCIIAWGLLCWWLALRTAFHIFEGNHGFIASLKYALLDLRTQCTFLPLVGPWFKPENDPRNWQEDDQKHPTRSDHR